MTSLSRSIFQIFCASCVIAYFTIPAYAEGSFLLQLGTFETHDEAARKWDDVKSANSDVVGKLQGHVAEVMLPPDNTPTYRTQVGPVASRKEAKALCKTLESRSVTCFVVETAFAASDLSPEMAGDVASAAPAAPVKAEPVVAPEPVSVPAEEQVTTSNMDPIAITQPAVSPVPAATPAAAPKEIMPAATVVAADTEEAAPAPKKTTVRVARKHSNSNFNPNDMKKSGFFRGAFNTNSDETEQTETVAAAPEPETKPAPVKTADADDDKPGFFGRLFGRSSHKEEKPAPVPVETAAPVAVAAAASPADKGPPTKTYVGNVEVAEAIRVPVTENPIETSEVKYVPVKDSHPAEDNQPEVIGDDSSIYWVQVGYFANENEAHNYYRQLYHSMPKAFNDSMRVRVTRPFTSRNSKASLRIGAFVGISDVKAVCADARAHSLRCTYIRDAGTEAAAPSAAVPAAAPAGVNNPLRKKYPSPLEAVSMTAAPADDASANVAAPASAATTAAPVVSNTVPSGPYMNLGGFSTAQSAWNHWKVLQSAVPALHDVKYSIAGSIGHVKSEKYQLRAGPTVTDVDAENLCKAVVSTGNICSVASPE